MCDKMVDLGILPNGCHLYRKSSKAGGHTYYSDECGVEAIVWDTCICTESTLLAAIVCEHHRNCMQHHIDKGWQPRGDDPEMEVDQMAATGGSFIPPDLREALRNNRKQKDGTGRC